MIKQFEKGWSGWDSEEELTTGFMIAKLKDRVAENDWIDVAAYAMFLMNHEDDVAEKL